MSSDIAIKVEGLSKRYEIYDQPRDRLKQFVMPRLQRLSKGEQKQYFKEFWALRDVSFEVKKGETVGIIGRNGSGKSTLLQMICGTLSPTSGSIQTNGRIAALLELGSGFNPEFTGRENVYMNAAVLGLSKDEIDARFDDILAFADIGVFIDQPVKIFSSGMYVRLAFSVAIHVDPDVLVVDEALSVGDFLFQQKCNRYLREKLTHTTKVLVTHDMAAISNMANRALVLRKGKLIYEGNSQSALEKYLVVSRLDESYGGEFEKKPDDSEIININESKQGLHVLSDGLLVSEESLSGTLRVRLISYSWFVDGISAQKKITSGCRFSVLFEILSDIHILLPIIGYQVQNRFGTVIFGENTISSGLFLESIGVGKSIVNVEFIWPKIETGQYSVTIGIGSGDDSHDHIIECWAHNIIPLDSSENDPVHGVFNQRLDNVKICPEK